MSVRRRNFVLGGFAALFGANKVDAKQLAAAATATARVPAYGAGVRKQVFEVIVRQALAGAPWKEICSGPMQVNNITPAEVEAEVAHRQHVLKDHPVSEEERAQFVSWCPECNDEIGQAMRAAHPRHPGLGDIWTCPTCRDERSTFAAEQQTSHAQHEHYATACPDCWSEYRAGARAHPKFGRLRPKDDASTQ